MFHNDNGIIRRTRNGAIVCELDELDTAIDSLAHIRNQLAVSDDDAEERYTAEGIDRYFEASPDFAVSTDYWREDSARNWEGIPGTELFRRYQKHAETYCWGCRDSGEDPTYRGFVNWLIMLRDYDS